MMSNVARIHHCPNSISKPRGSLVSFSGASMEVISQDFVQNMGYSSLICLSWKDGRRSSSKVSTAPQVRSAQSLTLSLKSVYVSLDQDQAVSQDSSQNVDECRGLDVVVCLVGQNSFEGLMGSGNKCVLVEEALESYETIIGDGVDHLAEPVARRPGELHHAMANDWVATCWSWQVAQWAEEVGIDAPTVGEKADDVSNHEPFCKTSEAASRFVVGQVKNSISFDSREEESEDELITEFARHDEGGSSRELQYPLEKRQEHEREQWSREQGLI